MEKFMIFSPEADRGIKKKIPPSLIYLKCQTFPGYDFMGLFSLHAIITLNSHSRSKPGLLRPIFAYRAFPAGSIIFTSNNF